MIFDDWLQLPILPTLLIHLEDLEGSQLLISQLPTTYLLKNHYGYHNKKSHLHYEGKAFGWYFAL